VCVGSEVGATRSLLSAPFRIRSPVVDRVLSEGVGFGVIALPTENPCRVLPKLLRVLRCPAIGRGPSPHVGRVEAIPVVLEVLERVNRASPRRPIPQAPLTLWGWCWSRNLKYAPPHKQGREDPSQNGGCLTGEQASPEVHE
jgi:hypothetical protein